MGDKKNAQMSTHLEMSDVYLGHEYVGQFHSGASVLGLLVCGVGVGVLLLARAQRTTDALVAPMV